MARNVTVFAVFLKIDSFGVASFYQLTADIFLRALSAVDVLTDRNWYDASSVPRVNPLAGISGILLSDFDTLCREVTELDQWRDINTVLALSAVVHNLFALSGHR